MKMQRKSKSRKVMGQRLNLFAWSGQETKYRKENPSYNISKTKFILKPKKKLSSHLGFSELPMGSCQV